MFETMATTLETWLAPVIQEMGVELVELKVHAHGRSMSFDVLVDKPQGGITLEECARINRFLSRQLEDNPLTDKNYVVQVSSPGLDRPLKTFRDFKRMMGRPVRFHLTQKIADKLEYSGVVSQVDDQHVTILLNASSITIPLSSIGKAVHVI